MCGLLITSLLGPGCDPPGWDIGQLEHLRHEAPSHTLELERGRGARWSARVERRGARSTFKVRDDQIELLGTCWSDSSATRHMPHLSMTKMQRDALTVRGTLGALEFFVGPEREQRRGRVARVSWGEDATTVRAECVRPLRQPERLLRDPRLLGVQAHELAGLALRRGKEGVELERRGAARWGPVGVDGELPAAPGVVRYAWRMEAVEEVDAGEPPAGALTLTATYEGGEDTLWLWEEQGIWLGRSRHTGATVRVGGDASGAVADLTRLMEQAREGALAPAHAVDPEHGAGQR